MVFASGLAAMVRHVPSPSAFYSYVAVLSRPLAVGTALIALIAYTSMQIGLYGALGPAAAAAWSGTGAASDGPGAWWGMWALGGLTVLSVLMQLRLRVVAIILAVLVGAEIAYVIIVDIVLAAHPAGGIPRFDAANPLLLLNPEGVASLVGAITGLIGFEVPLAFAAVAVSRRTTVPRTIRAVLLIVGVLLYGGTALIMSINAGPDQIIGLASAHPTDLYFQLASGLLPSWAIRLGTILYATSVFAATLAFTTVVCRYILMLAREGVLPGWFAITRGDEVPVTAAVTQSLLTLAALLVAFVTGLNPNSDLFFFGTLSGGLGVLIMMTITGAAVVWFFHRHRHQHLETWLRRRAAPITSGVLLAVITVLSILFFGDLLDTTSALKTWAPPLVYLAALIAGMCWARRMHRIRPESYQAIGQGGRDPQPSPQPAASAVVPALPR
jgi:amino acid transporter